MRKIKIPKLTRQDFADIDNMFLHNKDYTQKDREIIMKFLHEVFEIEDYIFKRGDVVECIDDTKFKELKVGELYMVKSYDSNFDGNKIPTVTVVSEHYGDGTSFNVYAKRFRIVN